MWSHDGFNVESDRGIRRNAKIQTGYQITVPPDYTELQVSAVTGVPALNSQFPGLPEMHAIDRKFTRVSPILWMCVVSWDGTDIDPIEEPPEIEWTDTESQEAIDEDWNGNPIVTANGEPIEGITMDIADNVLSVKRNYRFFNPQLTHQYRHSTNSDFFAGYAPGTGRLKGYRAKYIYDPNNGGYWEVHARIEFRFPYRTVPARAWYARVRHEGYYERLGNRIVRAADEHGEEVTRPILLAQNGTRESNPNNANWLEWQRYGSLPYNVLGLL